MAITHATGRGPEIVEVPPATCPNGHRLTYPNVQVFHLPCPCTGQRGHRGYRCWTCQAVNYDPPHEETTAPLTGGLHY